MKNEKLKNEKLKAKVIDKMIAWGGNEEEVHEMVEATFQNALDCGVSGVRRIAEYIGTISQDINSTRKTNERY